MKRVCQNCKYHKNKPSTCTVYKDAHGFVSRKREMCDVGKLKDK